VEWLDEIAHAITRSWPHTSAVGVRASLGDFEMATPGALDFPVAQRADFIVADGRSGSMEVRCREEGSDTAERPAHAALLDNVAEMLRIAVDRRLVMTALRRSEERYRSVVEHQSDLVCRFLPDTTLTFVNDAYCRFFDKRRDELLGRRFIELIPEVGREGALEQIESLVRTRQDIRHEHPVLLPDGRIGRQMWINHAIAAANGELEELQGIGRDITDRWRAEEALRQKEASLREAYERIKSLAHRLILAQEAERTEIARDLHDDVSQQVAALSIGLSLVETRLAEQPNTQREVARLREMAGGLAEKVRHVSHALHPGVLQHAGLSAAIASHCEAVAAQHAFSVSFDSRGAFHDVDSDIALCLYRAVQQALRNVAMHANATRSWVVLTRIGHQVELTITDNGRGFDPSTARARGLGLLSIEERVHLANGKFRVTSRPGGGARMTIQVPVAWS
jgi:PAS domain S-box-containing protein